MYTSRQGKSAHQGNYFQKKSKNFLEASRKLSLGELDES